MQWVVVLSLLFITAKRSRILLTLTLMSGLLMTQLAAAAGSTDSGTVVVIIGRIIKELASANSSSFLQLLPICWALSLAALQLFISQKSSERLLALGALAVLLPLTPLALALALSVGWCLRALNALQPKAQQSQESPSR
jgi:hypothetical protein